MKDNAESANETQKPNIDERTIRLVENFKTRSKSANRVVVILISVMITFWLSGLEPKGDAIANYLGVSKRRSEEITKVGRDKGANSRPSSIVRQEVAPLLHSDNNRSISGVSDKAPQGQRDLGQPSTQPRDKLGGVEARLKELKELESEAKKQAKVPYEFPGGLKASIPIETAPVIWIGFSLFCLLYVLVQRNVLLHLGSRIARKMVEAPQQAVHYQEILYDAPWWIAPLPSKRGQLVSKHDLKTIFGWTNDQHFSVMMLMSYILLILAQLKVLFLSYVFVNLDDRSRQEWIDYIAPTLATMLVLTSIILLVVSYFMAKVPDHLPAYEKAVPLSRRKLLYFAILGAFGSLSIGFLNRSIDERSTIREFIASSSSQFSSPRFRKIKPGHSIQQLRHSMNGLYVNKHSGTVHYVAKGGKIYSSASLQPTNLEALADNSNIPLLQKSISKLAASRLVWASESYALSLVEQNQVDTALQVLRSAVQTAYRNNSGKQANNSAKKAIRLSDLLAGLAVRHSRQQFLNELTTNVDFVCREFLVDEAIQVRLPKWSNPKSKWFQKWSKDSGVLPWKRGALLT